MAIIDWSLIHGTSRKSVQRKELEKLNDMIGQRAMADFYGVSWNALFRHMKELGCKRFPIGRRKP
jgi:3-oxoacyl-(acyl-carrier-protein) synthase